MKTPIEWYRELYQKGADLDTEQIAAIQADALEDLRDRFACAALTGLLAGDILHKPLCGPLAESAYNLADAMMVRRAQQTTASLEEAKQTVPHE